MVGVPPSARAREAIPHDPAQHAMQIAREWFDVADRYVRKRMRELGIPEQCIGYSDVAYGISHAAFMPHEGNGGSNVPGQRLAVDSGALNPELLSRRFGPKISSVWARSRLRDRIDAIIAHEHQEAMGRSHFDTIVRVANITLPISEDARSILRAIAAHQDRSGGDRCCII